MAALPDDTALRLHEAIAAVCPILGVSIADKADKRSWRIDYAPDATAVQRAAAVGALAAFAALAGA